MRQRTLLILVAVLGASLVISSAAFSSATVDRSATMDVVGDDVALTGLAPGDTSVVQYDTNNQLQIDFTQATNADGVNANANYTIGDTSNANETYAFNVTNNDDQAHDYTLSYAFDGTPDANSSVTFEVYDDTGAKVTEATDSTDSSAVNLAAGETAYVVIVADSTDSTPADTLSGELTISAT